MAVDPPAPQFDQVLIEVQSIQVHRAQSGDDGWVTIVEEPQTFDLLRIAEVRRLLGERLVEPGTYTKIRFTVSRATVVMAGREFDVKVPSESISLIRPFRIEEGKTTIILLDFNGERSLVVNGNDRYVLKPVVRVLAREPEVVTRSRDEERPSTDKQIDDENRGEPAPTPDAIEGEGVIRQVAGDSATIGNKKVQITHETEVDGQLQSGDRVKVRGDLQAEGSFIATKIESDDRRAELEGILESMSPTLWAVNGQRVRLTVNIEITGVASVGSQVRVQGTRQSNGTILALKIEVKRRVRALGEDGGQEPPDRQGDANPIGEDRDALEPTPSPSPTIASGPTDVTDIKATPELHRVLLGGTIQGISDNRLRVEGRTVVINDRTKVEGTPMLGLKVRIEGVERSNGTILATRVIVARTGN